MKRFLVVALAAVALLASSEAQAQRYYYRSAYRPARTYNYNTYNTGYYNGGYSSGPFSRLMELERAKNAWLRSTFMGY